MTSNVSYDAKMKELISKVEELAEKTSVLGAFVSSSYDHDEFHERFDPITETAEAVHELYEELLHLGGHHHPH